MSLIHSIGCRVRQAAIRAAHPGRVDPPSVEEGTGSVFTVAQLLRAHRLHKPMLVSAGDDEAVRDRVLHALKENDLSWCAWEAPERALNAADAEELRMTWVREACDSFIVMGDGALIDFCKVAAALAAVKGRSFQSLVGTDRIRRRLPPLVAVPTATGSGAEALAWASLADETGESRVIADRALVPRFLVLDPELMENVSRPKLAEAAFDGLALAVEACLSRYADEGCRASAADAVSGYLSVLEPCWNSGGTPAQRSALMAASRLAGEAASFAGPGYIRALSRSVIRHTGADAGPVYSAILPVVMEKYGRYASSRLAALAEQCELAAEGSATARAEALTARLRQLAFRIGLPDTLEPLTKAVIGRIAEDAAAEANPRYACPVVWTAEELAEVLGSACEAVLQT